MCTINKEDIFNFFFLNFDHYYLFKKEIKSLSDYLTGSSVVYGQSILPSSQ